MIWLIHFLDQIRLRYQGIILRRVTVCGLWNSKWQKRTECAALEKLLFLHLNCLWNYVQNIFLVMLIRCMRVVLLRKIRKNVNCGRLVAVSLSIFRWMKSIKNRNALYTFQYISRKDVDKSWMSTKIVYYKEFHGKYIPLEQWQNKN